MMAPAAVLLFRCRDADRHAASYPAQEEEEEEEEEEEAAVIHELSDLEPSMD